MEIKTTLFGPKLKNTQTDFTNFLSAFDGEDGKNTVSDVCSTDWPKKDSANFESQNFEGH